ncbi:hypothetical protein [Amycolatopsis sp. NPDC059657]|uniref:hypothetical protein n=1 Tax=Amycolatopsis sp. NPDC059657 TaxID=3346899 RepID=UPI00366C6D74
MSEGSMSVESGKKWTRQVSRRGVLLAGGGALVLAGLRSATAPLSFLTASATPASTLHLVRPQDMLVLDFDFYNLRPDFSGDEPQLRQIDESAYSYVVVRFEAQHISEQTFYEGATPSAPGAVAGKAVGPSRIAFLVPETVKSLPYSERGLLGWWQWIMQVVEGKGVPDELRTDLLLVDWLHLTPERSATWAHAIEPVEHGGRTELWHTRLSQRGTDGKPSEVIGFAQPPSAPTIRAVHADTPTATEAGLFKTLVPSAKPTEPGQPPATWRYIPDQLVDLTSNAAVDVRAPVRADLLALSATGATLDFDGKWAASANVELQLDVAGWEHHSWQGRDNKVVVEQYGFLFPFGHRARLITETKRLIDDAQGMTYLRQRQFIRISEPVKSFPAPHQRFGGRAFPFSRITITTAVLPDLPETREALVAGHGEAFWISDINAPTTGGHSDVVFSVSALDVTGRLVDFTTPMAFVPYAVSVDPDQSNDLFTKIFARYGTYDELVSATPDPRRRVELAGQEVAYAPEEKPGTATFPTQRMFWGVEGPVPGVLPPLKPGQQPDPAKLYADVNSPLFYPRLLAAQITAPAVDAIIGTGQPFFLVPDKIYLGSGVGTANRAAASGNQAQIFARVQKTLPGVAELAKDKPDPKKYQPVARAVESSETSGGVLSPNLVIGAWSNTHGPFSGSYDVIEKTQQEGKVSYGDYFPKSDLASGLTQAALFGGIYLAQIIPDGSLGNAVKLIKETQYPPKKGNPKEQDTSMNPTGLKVSMKWGTPLKSFGPFVVLNKDKKPVQSGEETISKLDVLVVNKVDYLTRKTESTTTATVSDFWIALPSEKIDFLVLKFTKFEFKYQPVDKISPDPDIDGVAFAGPFEFVNVLQRWLTKPFGSDKKKDGGSAPPPPPSNPKLAAPKSKPIIDLSTDHVGVGVSLGLPGIELGAFMLTGIRLNMALVLPFDGKPVRAKFGFASESAPFELTIYGLGGGGFFALEVSSRPRLEVVEAALQFGGCLALDVFVASGRLSIYAGIYFKLERGDENDPDPKKRDDTVTLRGYLDADGRLSVLGLITIAAHFHLDLEWKKKGEQSVVTGHASLVVSIDLFFISESVTVSVEKTFAGGESGSTFALAAGETPRRSDFGDLVSKSDWHDYCSAFAA